MPSETFICPGCGVQVQILRPRGGSVPGPHGPPPPVDPNEWKRAVHCVYLLMVRHNIQHANMTRSGPGVAISTAPPTGTTEDSDRLLREMTAERNAWQSIARTRLDRIVELKTTPPQKQESSE